jgi:hypothetical protein
LVVESFCPETRQHVVRKNFLGNWDMCVHGKRHSRFKLTIFFRKMVDDYPFIAWWFSIVFTMFTRPGNLPSGHQTWRRITCLYSDRWFFPSCRPPCPRGFPSHVCLPSGDVKIAIENGYNGHL